MSFEACVDAGRTVDFTVPIYESDGSTAIVLAATDVVRVKIGRRETVSLDLDSVAATENGSVVTVDETNPASVTVRLAQADTIGLDGAYDCEVSVVDDSEESPADAIKCAEKGVIHFLPSMSGDVGKT